MPQLQMLFAPPEYKRYARLYEIYFAGMPALGRKDFPGAEETARRHYRAAHKAAKGTSPLRYAKVLSKIDLLDISKFTSLLE